MYFDQNENEWESNLPTNNTLDWIDKQIFRRAFPFIRHHPVVIFSIVLPASFRFYYDEIIPTKDIRIFVYVFYTKYV